MLFDNVFSIEMNSWWGSISSGMSSHNSSIRVFFLIFIHHFMLLLFVFSRRRQRRWSKSGECEKLFVNLNVNYTRLSESSHREATSYTYMLKLEKSTETSLQFVIVLIDPIIRTHKRIVYTSRNGIDFKDIARSFMSHSMLGIFSRWFFNLYVFLYS